MKRVPIVLVLALGWLLSSWALAATVEKKPESLDQTYNRLKNEFKLEENALLTAQADKDYEDSPEDELAPNTGKNLPKPPPRQPKTYAESFVLGSVKVGMNLLHVLPTDLWRWVPYWGKATYDEPPERNATSASGRPLYEAPVKEKPNIQPPALNRT